ncbi:unnamed protein product [Effrenium voratum]|nr:unnamed protein product [Effrenium voratum]
MLFGLIKALIKAIKMLIKTLKAIVKIAKSLKMPDLSGEFLPDIPGLPKMPSLALPAGLSLPSPPKLSLGKMFSMVGFGLGALLAPLLILAALALLSKYRIFKARLWPPLSGLPGLRNPLFRLPYKDFKSVFGHLPYFNQLQTAGIPIFGLPKGTKNPGKQPQSPSIPPPKIEGLGARDYDAVMKGYDYSHGVKLGKNLMLHSLILRMSMIFKLGKEKIPFMGPPTVKEMFGTEGFMQKIIRLLAKGELWPLVQPPSSSWRPRQCALGRGTPFAPGRRLGSFLSPCLSMEIYRQARCWQLPARQSAAGDTSAPARQCFRL